jgi:(S)-sulfolactate dehydrogenase
LPDIVITEIMHEAAIEDLRRDHEVHYDPSLLERPDEIARRAGNARALIVRNRTRVTGDLLAACGRLEAIGRLGVGLDNIDLEACRARGIAVLPATGANDVSVAEYVIAGILMLLRRAYHSSGDVLAGAWPRQALTGREASGRVLGLVGFGNIARETARRARALGMSVIAADPFVPADDPAWAGENVRRVELDELLAAADVVSLHVPLTDGTRRLIDAAALARMRDDAVLINAARGAVVDEAALAEALRAGRLAGAMLDVFEHEPLPGGGPLAGVPRLILSPHIAGVTEESNVRVSAVTAANVRRALGGDK